MEPLVSVATEAGRTWRALKRVERSRRASEPFSTDGGAAKSFSARRGLWFHIFLKKYIHFALTIPAICRHRIKPKPIVHERVDEES